MKPASRKPAFHPDVNHELTQAILLSQIVRDGSVRSLPPLLQSAVHTAFAAHFRTLMEFFHDGAPSKKDWARILPEPRQNVRYSQISGAGANPFAGTWTKADLRRVRDAHKLMGHLAEERQARRRMRKEWGTEADWRLLRPKIRHLLKLTAADPTAYAGARAAADLAELGRS